MTERDLRRSRSATSTDVFALAARRPARSPPPSGSTSQDQVRLATALSEVSRDVLAAGGGRRRLHARRAATLIVAVVTVDGDLGRRGLRRRSTAAQRLMDLVGGRRVDDAGRPSSRSASSCPPAASSRPRSPTELPRRLPRHGGAAARLDELRAPEPRAGRGARGGAGANATSCDRVNAELEETNRGVMALYDELSERAGAHQPGRGRALRRDRRQEPAAAARPASPRPASSTTSATSCAPPSTPCSAWPGCCSTPAPSRSPTSSATRSSSSRPAPRTCSGWSTSCSTWPRPSPAGSSRPSAHVDLGGLLRRAARHDRARWSPGPGVQLVIEPPRRAGGPRTDRTLLRHVLRNLLSNAVKFTESGHGHDDRPRREGGRRPARRHATPASASPRTTSRGSSRSSTRSAARCSPRSTGSGLGLPFARRRCAGSLLGRRPCSWSSVPGEGTDRSRSSCPRPGPPATGPGEAPA